MSHMISITRFVLKRIKKNDEYVIEGKPVVMKMNLSQQVYDLVKKFIIPVVLTKEEVLGRTMVSTYKDYCPVLAQFQICGDVALPMDFTKEYAVKITGNILEHVTEKTAEEGKFLPYPGGYVVKYPVHTVYDSSYSTSGMVKNNSLWFVGVGVPGANVQELHHKITFGARKQRMFTWEHLGLDPHEFPFADWSKPVVRDSLGFAPGVDLGVMKNFCIFCGKFGLTRDPISNELSIGNPSQELEDGTSFTNADELLALDPDLVQNLIGDLAKEKGSAQNPVAGVTLQIRPGMGKCTSQSMTSAAFSYILEQYKKNGVEVISADSVTYEQQIEFNKLFVKGQSSKFKNKLLMIVQSQSELKNAPVALFDLNAWKDMYDLTMPVPYRVIGYAHAYKNNPKIQTSVQLMRGMMDCDFKNTKDYFKELFSKDLERVSNNLFGKDNGVIFLDDLINSNSFVHDLFDDDDQEEDENCANSSLEEDLEMDDDNSNESFEDLEINAFNLISNKNPQFVREFLNPILQQKLKTGFEGLISAIRGHNHKVTGASCVMLPDPAHCFFGIKVLGYNQKTVDTFIPGFKKHLSQKGKIKKVVGIKYPNSGSREKANSGPIDKAEYIDATIKCLVAKNNPTLKKGTKAYWQQYSKTKEEIKFFTEYIYSLKGKLIFMPVSTVLASTIAGYDFDGDKMSVYTDQKIVSIMEVKDILIELFDEITLDIIHELQNSKTLDEQPWYFPFERRVKK